MNHEIKEVCHFKQRSGSESNSTSVGHYLRATVARAAKRILLGVTGLALPSQGSLFVFSAA